MTTLREVIIGSLAKVEKYYLADGEPNLPRHYFISPSIFFDDHARREMAFDRRNFTRYEYQQIVQAFGGRLPRIFEYANLKIFYPTEEMDARRQVEWSDRDLTAKAH